MAKKRWNEQWLFAGVVGLCCMTGGWIINDAIAPQPAHAYVARVDVVLDIQPGERYEAFLSRAETVARAAIQRSFDRDILTSEVYAIIVGQRQGASVQVLSAQMSRNQWRSRPDPRRWATYYPSARILLGFGAPTRGTPQVAPAAAAPQPTSVEVQSIPVVPSIPIPPTTPFTNSPSEIAPNPTSPQPNLPDQTPPNTAPGTTPLPPPQQFRTLGAT